MDNISFREKIVALQSNYKQINYDYDTTLDTTFGRDFWYVMDSISDELVLKWADRVSKLKDPVHDKWHTKDWLRINSILHHMKTYDKYNEMPWSHKQKRFCTFMIIKFWDDLEMDYYC